MNGTTANGPLSCGATAQDPTAEAPTAEAPGVRGPDTEAPGAEGPHAVGRFAGAPGVLGATVRGPVAEAPAIPGVPAIPGAAATRVRPCPRPRRPVFGAGLVAVAALLAAVAVSGCEPGAGGGLSPTAVALTTDRTTTHTLERLGVDVRWLSCTASVGGGSRSASAGSAAPDASVRRPATVACEGETAGRQKITLNGKVTDERSGACVRGDLTARLDSEVVFDATYLGDCDEPSPTRTTRPIRPAGVPTATVTETVTATVTRTTAAQK